MGDTPRTLVTPHELGEIDHRDPLNHSRGVAPSVQARLSRRMPKVKWERPWPTRRKIWSMDKLQVQFPELFRIYYTDDCIRQFQGYTQPRPEVLVWIKDILAAGGGGCDSADRYTVAIFPGMNRECVWERVPHPERGDTWQMIYMAMGPTQEGVLPPDLQTENGRWEHLRGQVGEYRALDADDFRTLRRLADTHALTAKQMVRQYMDKQKKAYDDDHRAFADELRDMAEYRFDDIYHAITGLTRTLPMTSKDELATRVEAEKFERRDIRDAQGRVTAKIIARRGTRAAGEIKTERAAQEVALARIDEDAAAREQAARLVEELLEGLAGDPKLARSCDHIATRKA